MAVNFKYRTLMNHEYLLFNHMPTALPSYAFSSLPPSRHSIRRRYLVPFLPSLAMLTSPPSLPPKYPSRTSSHVCLLLSRTQGIVSASHFPLRYGDSLRLLRCEEAAVYPWLHSRTQRHGRKVTCISWIQDSVHCKTSHGTHFFANYIYIWHHRLRETVSVLRGIQPNPLLHSTGSLRRWGLCQSLLSQLNGKIEKPSVQSAWGIKIHTIKWSFQLIFSFCGSSCNLS